MLNCLNLIIVIITSVSFLASFFPNWGLWGVDYFRVFPWWLRLFLLAGVLTFSLHSISKFSGKAIQRKIMTLGNKSARGIGILITGIYGLCFALFLSENHLLGDGYNVLGNISGGLIFSPAEPLSYILHHYLSVLIGTGDVATVTAYRVSSLIAGILFIWGMYYYAKEKRDFLLLAVIAICFSTFQFFFGYVENYTFSFLLVTLYLLSALNDLCEKRLSAKTPLLLLGGMLFHFSSGVFIPSFIFLVFVLTKSKKIAYLLLLGTVMVVGVAVGIILTHFEAPKIFLSLSPTESRAYSLFSLIHLKDMVNTLLLTAPLIFALPFLFQRLRGTTRIFLAIAGTFGLLFSFTIDPTLGAYRDWDLLSIFAAPILVFYFALLRQTSRQINSKLYASMIPLLLFAVIHTGSWIWLNASRQGSYNYAKQVVANDIHYSLKYQQGFRNKSWGYIARNKMDDPHEAVRAWELRYQGEPNDYLNIQSLIRAYGAVGDTADAVELIRREWPRFLLQDTTISLMATFLSKARYYEEAEKIYENLLRLNRADFRILNDLAVIRLQMGKVDSAVITFDKAFQSWPAPPYEDQLRFYVACYRSGYRELSLRGLGRMKASYRESDQFRFDGLLNALENGDEQEAEAVIKQILSLK